MKFTPPVIAHIDEVLPFIEGHKGYSVKKKGEYTVIDYVYSSEDMFKTPIERECRGLKFCSRTGILKSRPYHKFHNLDEREEYRLENIDFDEPHVILDKLDGSMVHTYFTTDLISGKRLCRLHTRAGESEVALNAEAFFRKQAYYDYFKLHADEANTYIFEYVGPKNKIVLNYLREELILTAIRNVRTGLYVEYEGMQKIAAFIGVKCVEEYSKTFMLDEARADEDKEGFVVRFQSGAMAKVKSDIYVRRHKSKELTSSFKNLTQIIIDNQLDDILPQLEKGLRMKVEEFAIELVQNLYSLSIEIETIVEAKKGVDRKDFAQFVIDKYPKPMHHLLFGVRDGKESMELVDKLVRRNCGSSNDLENLFNIMNWTKWTGSFFEE